MPIMNKTGYSMYWNSMWDDKLNYSRSLKDDIFLKNFMYIFFEGGSNFIIPLNLKHFEKKFKLLKRRYNFQVKKVNKKNELGDIVSYKYVTKKRKKFRPYLSKIWILKYQTWVIIYFYSYSFNLSVFFKKKLKKSDKFKKYYNIVFNYYKNLIKINYNYDFYNENLNTFFF